MADILKPRDGRKAYVHGVAHDGAPRAQVPITPGMIANPDRGHEANQEQRQNIALQGKPKAHQNVSLHGGMTSQQQAGHGAGGLGHATSPAVCDEPLSLDPTVAKSLTPPKVSPGMKTR
jgi:hypothetical protein